MSARRFIVEGTRNDTGETIERKVYKSGKTAAKEYLIRLATLASNKTRNDEPPLTLRTTDELSYAYQFGLRIEDTDGVLSIKLWAEECGE